MVSLQGVSQSQTADGYKLPTKLASFTVGFQTHASCAQPHLLSAAELTPTHSTLELQVKQDDAQSYTYF